MIKRLAYVISTLLVYVLNLITFIPLFFLGLIWTCIIEPIVWIVRGRTVLRDPFDALGIALWGCFVLNQLEMIFNLE